MARAVRAIYFGERIYRELLKIDQDIHARLGTAAVLAATQMAMAHNADVAKTLYAFEPSKMTVMKQALLGIALVRIGEVQDATTNVPDSHPSRGIGNWPLNHRPCLPTTPEPRHARSRSNRERP
jgi:hypothetical protein